MIPRRLLPPLAIAIAWLACAVAIALSPAWLRGADESGWLAAALLALGATALAAALSGRLPAAVRPRLADALLAVLGPLVFLVAAAGGVRSPAVALLALVALGTAARRGVAAGLAAALGALLLASAADLLLGRELDAPALLSAATLLLVGGVLPVWYAGRLADDGAAARRQLERVEGYVAGRRRTPERGADAIDPTPQGAALAEQAEGLVHLRSLDDYLRDVRDRTGADEVVLWRGVDGEGWPRAAGTSTEDVREPAYFDERRWAPLLRWSVEAEMVHAEHDDDVVRFVAAPLVRDGRRYGALTISSAAGLTLTHKGALEWAGRYADHAALLVQLLDIRGEHGHAARREQLLVQFAEAVHRGGTAEGVARMICDTAIALTSGSRAALVQWDARLEQGSIRALSKGHSLAEQFRVVADSAVGSRCVERLPLHLADARPLSASRSPIYGPGESLRTIGSLSIVPLERDRMVVGAIVVEGDGADSISSGGHKKLRLLATIAAGSLQLFEQIDEATLSARTDPLTGLYNRRHFDEQLRLVVAAAGRHGDETALVIADVDHFKRVNDSYGHEAGDAVLRHVARICRESVRPQDVCARFGGEEVVILCPRTGHQGARLAAERLRRAIASSPLRYDGLDIAVTASFGVASHPHGVPDSDGLLGAADEALYAAKRDGRNQVKVYSATSDVAAG